MDAQFSPRLAPWIMEQFGINASPLREFGLRDARDHEIFLVARQANATVLTKDFDFVQLLQAHGPPPRVVWLRGNRP